MDLIEQGLYNPDNEQILKDQSSVLAYIRVTVEKILHMHTNNEKVLQTLGQPKRSNFISPVKSKRRKLVSCK